MYMKMYMGWQIMMSGANLAVVNNISYFDMHTILYLINFIYVDNIFSTDKLMICETVVCTEMVYVGH